MPFADLDGWLRERAAADQFSGVVLVRRGEQTVFSGAYGWASRRWPVPITMATRFDTASIGKLFTAVAALQLVDEQQLDLDHPITDLVDLAGTTISPQVTVRHVLQHTAGIADDGDEDEDGDGDAGDEPEEQWRDQPCYTATEARDFLPRFAYQPPHFPPGQGCRYCSAGYVLVGLVIEAATGTTYREHVRRTVLARAGMAESGFFDRREAVPDVAEGWDPVSGPADGDRENRTGWKENVFSGPPIGLPHGGAHVTAADLVTFLQAVRAGRLLSPASTKEFLIPQVKHHETRHGAVWHGLGLVFDVDQHGSVRHYHKDGMSPGASGILRHYPSRGLDLVVLSNSEYGAWDPVGEIHRRVRSV